MTRIPEKDRDLLEQALFLPMALTILNRDLQIIEKAPFKLRKPYTQLIESAMMKLQKDLHFVKTEMKKRKMKTWEVSRNETFTNFAFLYNGYEEEHQYFNPQVRNRVQEIMTYYLEKLYMDTDWTHSLSH